MNLYDYILLILLAYFVFQGIRAGFVRVIGGLAGVIIGAWLAGFYYDNVAQWLVGYFSMDLMLAIVLAFIGIFLVANAVINILAWLVTHFFRIIPLATTLNRLIGGVLGLVEGAILIGLIIWVITLFPFENGFTRGLQESKVAGYFEGTSKIIQPLLPTSLRYVDLDLLQQFRDMDQKTEYLQEQMPKFFEDLRRRAESMRNPSSTQDTVDESQTE